MIDISSVNLNTSPSNTMHPTAICNQHNSRNNKSSSKRHLGGFYARKRTASKRSIISGLKFSMIDYMNQPQVRYNIRTQTRSQFSLKPKRLAKICGCGGIGKPTVSTDPSHDSNFYPIDDPSYQNITWYDAISPYWTGDMVWNSAYVLNHQVVSVTTGPIFVSDLRPAFEMSATIHTPEAKSGGENVGPRATIALDSGSSIHIFKDSFLLADIQSDASNSTAVGTTDSKFPVNDIGRLCDDLNTLPLPSRGD